MDWKIKKKINKRININCTNFHRDQEGRNIINLFKETYFKLIFSDVLFVLSFAFAFALLRAPRVLNLVILMPRDLCVAGESLSRGTDCMGAQIVRVPPLRLPDCGCED